MQILSFTSPFLIVAVVLVFAPRTAIYAATNEPSSAVSYGTKRNGKIAFTSDRDGNREIYLMNADGSDQTRVTNNSTIDDFPTWSPDGTRIAFLGQRAGGGYAIFTMNPDGSGKVEVTTVNYQPASSWNGIDWRHMSWSPDGSQIVFTELVGTVGTLFVVSSDGSGRRQLTTGFYPAWSPDGTKIMFVRASTPNPFYNLHTIRPDGTDLRFIPTTFQSNYILWDSPPVWSPDGQKIIVNSSDSANAELDILNADGSSPVFFADLCAYSQTGNAPAGCGANWGSPAWSPDGRTVVFAQFDFTSRTTEIYSKAIGGGSTIALTQSPGSNSNPSWQPLPPARRNGKIAFTSDRDGNREIYVMNEDGTDETRLTFESIVDDHPTWSPDGTKIAFVSQPSGGGFGIFTMDADGGNRTEITHINFNPESYYFWSMSWSPDGNELAFQDEVPGDPTINVVNLSTRTRRFLTYGIQPAWSPAGALIAFAQKYSHERAGELQSIRPDGTDQRLMFGPDLNDWFISYLDPKWSPSGEELAFYLIDWANGTTIESARPDGTGQQTIYSGMDVGNYFPSQPDWAPNGQKIVFSGQALGGGASHIFVTGANGTGVTQLTNTNGRNANPSWQPLRPAVSVSGKVTGPNGQGLRNTTVTLTDSVGTRRTVATSSFGLYSFTDLTPGEAYSIGAVSKRFRFTVRTIQVGDADLSNVDLVGQE